MASKDWYQYPVFFEVKNLTNNSDKEKIKRHFNIKRNGGGECGEVEKVGEDTYKISFQEKEARERVLDGRDHVIALSAGELRLSVSRDRCPPNPADPDQPLLETSRDKHAQSNEKELEKVLSLNQYLLKYLTDCPKAAKDLDKQLSSINSSIQLRLETEEAVVKGVVALVTGTGAASLQWETQVDQIFSRLKNRYRLHEMDPNRLKNLTSLATDDVKVYLEGNAFAVVVGEVGEVEEKLKIAEEKLQIRKDLPILERRYSLVKEELGKELKLNPEVKISHDGHNTLVLEGPANEVQLLLTKLDKLMKRIQEKQVQPDKVILDFMVSSGAISRYQNRFQHSLHSRVTLENRHLDLILSSLSSNALEEAAATFRRELCLETQQLEGTVDLSRLKEALRKAQDQVNLNGPRVKVIYHQGSSGDPRTSVQLVGYRKEVGTLKEVLLDYRLNQVEVHESLPLPLPEMVDSFDKVRSLVGKKLNPSVKLTPSHSPAPCVGLSGSRCLVQETRDDLMAMLGCLTWDKLSLAGPGALQYYMGEGKRNMELVESSAHVLIWPQQERQDSGAVGSRGAGTLAFDLDDITLTVGGVQMQLVFGDITNEVTDVVVNCTDFVDLQSGVCKDILTMAGPQVETELRSAHVTRGRVFVSKPGRFPCKAILHVCGQQDANMIQGLASEIMKTCEQKGYQSVAIPAICTGKGGMCPKVVANAILQGVKAMASTPLHHLSLVRLILIDIDVFLAFKDAAKKLSSTSNTGPDLSSLLPSSGSPDLPSVFLVLGQSDTDVSMAADELRKIYEAQCSQYSFTREDLANLTQDEVDEMSRQITSMGLSKEHHQGQGMGPSAQESWTVSGLKDRVNSVVQRPVQLGSLRRSLREREQGEGFAGRGWWGIPILILIVYTLFLRT